MKHTSLGPSSWDRWVRCPGSVYLSAEEPDKANYAAAEGSAFHHMVERHLEHGTPLDWFLGRDHEVDGFTVLFDDDMVRHAARCADLAEEFLARPGWQVHFEVEVDISPWTQPGQMGTADVLAWSVEERKMVVMDWKYGAGVPVRAETSYQLRGYALGAWATHGRRVFGDDGVHSDVSVLLIIEQPRHRLGGGQYQTTVKDLLRFGKTVRAAAADAERGPEASFVPGEAQCRFCRARTKCSAFAEWNLEAVAMDFEDLDKDPVKPVMPRTMTPERRSTVLRMAPMLRKWLDDLHASAFRDAELGLPVPGFRLAEGRRPPRKWLDDQMEDAEFEANLWAGEEAFTAPKLKSPAQLEKLVGKKPFDLKFGKFLERGEPKPVLVEDDSDDQPTIDIQDFEDLDGGTDG